MLGLCLKVSIAAKRHHGDSYKGKCGSMQAGTVLEMELRALPEAAAGECYTSSGVSI